jgi:Reverse transcriptase (RNA-dependent DNA polymerase)
VGIAALEDKSVPQAVVTLLTQMDAEDVRGFSSGVRPGRSPHQALDALAVALTRKPVNDVLDGDMRGVFDTLAHACCVKGLPPRVADPRVLRLLQTWLRAGGSEEGQGSETTVGVPPGAVVSPLLAHVDVHDVFDLGGMPGASASRQGTSWLSALPMTVGSASSPARMQRASWRRYETACSRSGWSSMQRTRAYSSVDHTPWRTGSRGEKASQTRSTCWASRLWVRGTGRPATGSSDAQRRASAWWRSGTRGIDSGGNAAMSPARPRDRG